MSGALESFYRKGMAWLRLNQLRRELRRSEQFLRECEKLGCSNLATLEKRHCKEIEAKIERSESRVAPEILDQDGSEL